MAAKQALVVDDSKTARVLLKRMLEELKLTVVTTESADEAIEYLKSNLPDVIFMDHMMPGMDGFEAVKEIKKDARTAVIPIMMYTSRGGDLYLSQARALGAVGIIPKTISPVGLKESLFKLGLVKDRRKEETPQETPLEIQGAENSDEIVIDVSPSTKKPAAKKAVTKKSASKKTDTKKQTASKPAPKTKQDLIEEDLINNQKQHDTYIEDLQRIMDDQTIELHKSMWLGVESVSHEIFNRLNSELEEKFNRIEAAQEEAAIQNSKTQNKYLLPLIVIGTLLLLSLIYNIILFTDNKRINTEVAVMKKQAPVSASFSQMQTERPEYKKVDNRNTAVQFFRQANNKKINFPFNELALNENRINDIDKLVNNALNSGYTGKIILKTHIGKFCLNNDLAGNYSLADDKSPITQCQYIGNYLHPTDTPTTHQSLSFANYLSDSGSLIANGIILEVENDSRNIELSRYPAALPNTTAKEWNQAARENNSVTVILRPASKESIINAYQ